MLRLKIHSLTITPARPLNETEIRELTIAPARRLNETEMEPEPLSTTYYVAACSEVNAGLKNRTPGKANLISGIPLSSIISTDSPLEDLAARVQLLTRETVCGSDFYITSFRDSLRANGGFYEQRSLPTK